MYFVTECTTISTPKFNGFCKYGVRNVESTQEIALYCFASFAIAAISVIFNNGFESMGLKVLQPKLNQPFEIPCKHFQCFEYW